MEVLREEYVQGRVDDIVQPVVLAALEDDRKVGCNDALLQQVFLASFGAFIVFVTRYDEVRNEPAHFVYGKIGAEETDSEKQLQTNKRLEIIANGEVIGGIAVDCVRYVCPCPLQDIESDMSTDKTIQKRYVQPPLRGYSTCNPHLAPPGGSFPSR